MNKILDARDLAKVLGITGEDGEGDVRKMLAVKVGEASRGLHKHVTFDPVIAGEPVTARIDFGRWIADCPICGGAEAVSPLEKIFFCFSCFNEANNGHVRGVTFPSKKKREEIEGALLKRSVKLRGGQNQWHQLFRSHQPVPRTWHPHETVEDLHEQNRQKGVK